MTIRQVLQMLDESRFNTVPQDRKLFWLHQLDLMALEMQSDNFQEDVWSIPDYTPENLDRELRIPAPYDSIYVHWLNAWVDLENDELDRHNNDVTLFRTLWERYESHILRTNTPKNLGQFG